MKRFPTVNDYKDRINRAAQKAVECGIYEEDELEDGIKFLTDATKEALDSYPKGHKHDLRNCPRCGLPMVYDSLAWHEGFHFDTCY